MGLFHYEVTTGYCRVKVCEKCGELLVTPYKMFRKLPFLSKKTPVAIGYAPAKAICC